MSLVENKILIIELREGLLAAEIDKRWALSRMDVKGFLSACARIKQLNNAIFMAEAATLAQEKRGELLPPRVPSRARSTESK